VALDLLVLLVAIPLIPLLISKPSSSLGSALGSAFAFPWSTTSVQQLLICALVLFVAWPLWLALLLSVAVIGVAWDALVIGLMWAIFPLMSGCCKAVPFDPFVDALRIPWILFKYLAVEIFH
jgi:hypothetical protein